MKQFKTQFKIKSLAGDGTFEGYGSVFGVKDSYGDVVEKGAFTETLKQHAERGTMPKMLAFHDFQQIPGVYTEMREDDYGLFVRGKYLLTTELGRDQYELAKAGAIDGLSIGYDVPEGGEEYDDEARVNRLKTINLWEVSLVPFPANSESRLTGVKASDLPSIRTIEQALRDAGLSRKQAKALLADGYKATPERDATDAEHAEKLKNYIKGLRNV